MNEDLLIKAPSTPKIYLMDCFAKRPQEIVRQLQAKFAWKVKRKLDGWKIDGYIWLAPSRMSALIQTYHMTLLWRWGTEECQPGNMLVRPTNQRETHRPHFHMWRENLNGKKTGEGFNDLHIKLPSCDLDGINYFFSFSHMSPIAVAKSQLCNTVVLLIVQSTCACCFLVPIPHLLNANDTSSQTLIPVCGLMEVSSE